MTNNLTTLDIECRVAAYFNPRVNLIVPNVYWGMGFGHELDICVLTPSGYIYEVEIKTSASDLKADLLKRHGHHSDRIRRLYYAVPEALTLAPCIESLPERAGLLVVRRPMPRPRYAPPGPPYQPLEKWREARNNRDARKITDAERRHLYHLASLRIWTLKQSLINNLGCA